MTSEEWADFVAEHQAIDERHRKEGPKGDGCLPRLALGLAVSFASFVFMVWLALQVLGR